MKLTAFNPLLTGHAYGSGAPMSAPSPEHQRLMAQREIFDLARSLMHSHAIDGDEALKRAGSLYTAAGPFFKKMEFPDAT